MNGRQLGPFSEYAAEPIEVAAVDARGRLDRDGAGLPSSVCDDAGRLYRLTAAGRARWRRERSFRAAFAWVMLRGVRFVAGAS